MSEQIDFLDKVEDQERISHWIDDYLNIIDHLRGNGLRGSNAPALMSRSVIEALEQRVTFLTVKLLAIDISQRIDNKSKAARIIENELPKELEKLKICGKNRKNYSTIRRWIASDVSETYPAPKK
jgi:hypothetical protein